jgi:hypothetical protein
METVTTIQEWVEIFKVHADNSEVEATPEMLRDAAVLAMRSDMIKDTYNPPAVPGEGEEWMIREFIVQGFFEAVYCMRKLEREIQQKGA